MDEGMKKVTAELTAEVEAILDEPSQAIISANERLGLPRTKMTWVVVAFDVDGTLIDAGPKYYEDIIQTLKVMSKWKNVKIVVWSGGGKEYAARWGRLLDIDKYVWKYASKTEWRDIRPDIAIDDIQDTAIGGINLIVRNK
jgi:phosphoserine phosphatase